MSTTITLSSQLSDLSTKLVIYYLIPMYVIGIFGNLFNIIMFSRRTLRFNTCSRYFVCMSIAQIIFFNSLALTRIITYPTGNDLGRTVAALCKIRNYLFTVSLALVRQFLCLIAIDRWIVSAKDEHIRQLSSPRIVRWLIIGSICFWIVFSIHALIGYQVSPERGCSTPSGSVYALFYSIQYTVSSIIPFIIMAVFSVFTLRNLRNFGRIQVIVQDTVTVTVVSSSLPQSTIRRRSEIQLIKLSLLQVIFYVVLSMTSTNYPLYSVITGSVQKTSNQIAIETFLSNTGLLLLYTYSAITFIVYTLASKTFRKECLLTSIQIFKYIKRFCF